MPRGAGFQSEVLAASNLSSREEGEALIYDFAVFDVTKDTLPVLQSWPRRDVESLPWITNQEQPASLIIAPGDQVTLTVWDAEDNSLLAGTGQRATPLQQTQVSTTGRIFVPYIGELQVAGMSPDTARSRIEEELIRTIPSAQVQLVVEAGRQNTANLVTGAAAPGLYQLPDRNFKILDLLSLAGGANPALINPQVRLVRNGRTYGVALDRLLAEPNLDAALQGGDRVMLIGDDRQFVSLGATGVEAVHDFPSQNVTALEAMAIVGGVSDARANPQGILILREYDSGEVRQDQSGPPQERVVFTIDLTSADGLFSAGNFLLEDKDLVYGTESPLGPALTAVGLINTVSTLSNQL
ncbi:polysaccharide biosynthesis/export family protein [Cognatiyoonia sp. IB215446]|uniref:polysaccharide biosynthesis/export family protein n=1 Tax=Cognatiyoonia sp. IB215446 TaxID=3097355 RepID=UPI002A0C4D52|nr:polysaccharide biosynthesis/export family protein [Cognatiyoonia sp. IB215446]MDX8349947.1 polysaccharide biosynthesis/export family protein [Cognatiyoonia sp. IB215446]